jgi:hypothetical protein
MRKRIPDIGYVMASHNPMCVDPSRRCCEGQASKANARRAKTWVLSLGARACSFYLESASMHLCGGQYAILTPES